MSHDDPQPDHFYDRLADAFQAGWEAFDKGDEIEDSPHRENLLLHESWVAGWNEGRSVWEELNDA